MNAKLCKTSVSFLAILFALILVTCGQTRAEAATPIRTEQPGVEKHSSINPLPTQPPSSPDRYKPYFKNNFVTVLKSGEWQKYVLGPTSFDGGYVIDVTPLHSSVNGAHVEHKVLPEYDGERWNDVLWMILPEQAAPLRVNVRVYPITDWPVVFVEDLVLEPGVWQGYCLQDAVQRAGYVIEINPKHPASFGARVEKTLIQPEFPWGQWVDVLRVQIPGDQPALEAQVKVYRTPDLPITAEFDAHLEPGVWHGFFVGLSRLKVGYVIEVTPLSQSDNQIERYTVQPEFDGQTWNDVARLMIPADRPALDVNVRIYAISTK